MTSKIFITFLIITTANCLNYGRVTRQFLKPITKNLEGRANLIESRQHPYNLFKNRDDFVKTAELYIKNIKPYNYIQYKPYRPIKTTFMYNKDYVDNILNSLNLLQQVPNKTHGISSTTEAIILSSTENTNIIENVTAQSSTTDGINTTNTPIQDTESSTVNNNEVIDSAQNATVLSVVEEFTTENTNSQSASTETVITTEVPKTPQESSTQEESTTLPVMEITTVEATINLNNEIKTESIKNMETSTATMDSVELFTTTEETSIEESTQFSYTTEIYENITTVKSIEFTTGRQTEQFSTEQTTTMNPLEYTTEHYTFNISNERATTLSPEDIQSAMGQQTDNAIMESTTIVNVFAIDSTTETSDGNSEPFTIESSDSTTDVYERTTTISPLEYTTGRQMEELSTTEFSTTTFSTFIESSTNVIPDSTTTSSIYETTTELTDEITTNGLILESLQFTTENSSVFSTTQSEIIPEVTTEAQTQPSTTEAEFFESTTNFAESIQETTTENNHESFKDSTTEQIDEATTAMIDSSELPLINEGSTEFPRETLGETITKTNVDMEESTTEITGASETTFTLEMTTESFLDTTSTILKNATAQSESEITESSTQIMENTDETTESFLNETTTKFNFTTTAIPETTTEIFNEILETTAKPEKVVTITSMPININETTVEALKIHNSTDVKISESETYNDKKIESLNMSKELLTTLSKSNTENQENEGSNRKAKTFTYATDVMPSLGDYDYI
ncbi:hypothetical protein FF38_03494 [Lucilia cuprina]|uniref:Zonadhesin n=1 Tax=Lucilia cuprina TaxID=7375 RepID=A0A0L0CIS8_LUCCU|nr:Zonadhesin [Lucilia cuprina]KNC32160.1 hypothetical protein FF38_03494 [Lucilia cuprina]